MQVGEDGHGNHAGHRVRRNPSERFEADERRLELPGKPMLAVHAQSEACDGDADLSRGDVAILEPRILEDAQDILCEAAALRRLMLDA